MRAQNAAEPRFEVASVHPVKFSADAPVAALMSEESALPCKRGQLTVSGTLVSIRSAGVCDLIRFAYSIDNDQVFGAPVPANGAKPTDYFYTVDARAPGSAAPDQAQLRSMLQALLADRFGLKLHRESREMSFYALLPGKNGPKLTPAVDGCKPHGVMGLVSTCNQTTEQLAKLLSVYAHRRVVDMTGLSGNFDVEIPFDASGGDMGGAIVAGAQEHLGLKLESRKGPTEVIVVDHVEAPPDN